MTPRALGTSIAGSLAIILLAGCTSGSLTALEQGGSQQPAIRLAAFDNCESLLNGLRSAAKKNAELARKARGNNKSIAEEPAAVAGPQGAAQDLSGSREAASDAAADHSGTNTHERDVDEPDLVKTDGKRIVSVTNGTVNVIDVTTATLTGSVALTAPATSGSAGTPASLTASSLMLSGDHALVLANSLVASPAGPAVAEPKTDLALEASGPALVLVDLSDRPTVLGTYEMEGRIVDARQVGTTARVVVTSTPSVKASAIDDSTVEDWLPEYSVTEDGHRTTNRVACESVRHPAAYSGSSLLSVLTFDLAAKKLGTGDPVTIVADGQTVYSTANNLYVATTNQWNLASKTETVETTVYQFDIAGSKKPEYIAAGCVPGVLLNQYSMSEWNGHLRLATTQQAKIVVNDPATGEEATPGRRARITAPADTATVRPSESSVSVLRRDGGKLVVAGKVGGLGKGERIYSVRFAQDVGYVVTFRQTDPLYTVDLRDPKSPRVLGELELTGYSAYLHPLDGNLLIGVGQEATTQGRRQGTLVSLFDVSDLSAPKRLAKYEVRLGSSEAEFDPHAFLYWAKTSTLVIPVSKAGRSAAVVLSISGTLITERGTIEHSEHTAVRRAIVIGETLWTVSASGAMAHDLAALTTEASIAW